MEESKSDPRSEKIQKNLVYNRNSYFYQIFGRHSLLAERLVYTWLSSLCEEYNGALWNMYELSNGAFYMAPNLKNNVTVECPGFCDEVGVSADAAGLIACLYATNQLANELAQDWIISLYHKIRDFAAEHDEAAKIFRAID